MIGLWPANSVGEDDIEVFADETRTGVLAVIHTLRQQMARDRKDRPNLALADFVAPKESGIPDWLGGFAVTSGHGLDEIVADFEARHDDYAAIMAKALADRLAEAFAERMHERVRKEFWGYAADENLSNEELIAEKYRGIRPAPGYPACPDHTEKRTLFDLLARRGQRRHHAHRELRDVAGGRRLRLVLLAPGGPLLRARPHPQDQVEDYARRKGMSLQDCERWLAPNLAYDPDLGVVLPDHTESRSISIKKTVQNGMASRVEASMPPKTTVPSDCWLAAPAPLAVTSGTTPRMKANEVMTIGRNRRCVASTAASTMSLPSARSSRANSTTRMAFLAASAIISTRPIWV